MRRLSSLPLRHARSSSAAFSTRAEWQRQVAQGPRLQDFLTRTSRDQSERSDSVAPERSSSPEESLQQIRQILAEIRQSVWQKSAQ
jgi:hypothetical protein